MREEDWVKEAMTDDLLVAQLLLRLRQLEQHASPPVKVPVAVVPLDWGMRQPRSRQMLRYNIVGVKKEGESTTGSPTTPLSWSGGTSFSGGGPVDGYEENSQPDKRSSGGRSKVNTASETTIRRSRKKKTFAQLRDEESLLLKERVHLKKDIANLWIVCEGQRARNESLKRMKLDLQLQSAEETPVALKEANCDGPLMEANSVDHTPMVLLTSVTCDKLDAVVCSSLPSNSCKAQKNDVATRENFFVLPDLNVPLEEGFSSEVLHGMS